MCVNRRSKLEQVSNDNKALVALMDLVLAIADYVTTPPGHRSNVVDRVARVQEGVREARRAMVLRQDGLEAKAAVEATVRHWEAYAEKARRRQEAIARLDLGSQSVAPPLEADDTQ